MPELLRFSECDIPSIVALEGAATDFPWREESLRSSIESGHSCFCFRNAGHPVAFAIMSLVLDEATLLNIAVHPQHQGQGLGRQLLEAALAEMEHAGAVTCLLEVRASNEAAQALYHSLGFCEAGQRRAYYPGPKGREDALIMCLPMGASMNLFSA